MDQKSCASSPHSSEYAEGQRLLLLVFARLGWAALRGFRTGR